MGSQNDDLRIALPFAAMYPVRSDSGPVCQGSLSAQTDIVGSGSQNWPWSPFSSEAPDHQELHRQAEGGRQQRPGLA